MDAIIRAISALETLAVMDPKSKGQASSGRSLPEQRRKKCGDSQIFISVRAGSDPYHYCEAVIVASPPAGRAGRKVFARRERAAAGRPERGRPGVRNNATATAAPFARSCGATARSQAVRRVRSVNSRAASIPAACSAQWQARRSFTPVSRRSARFRPIESNGTR